MMTELSATPRVVADSTRAAGNPVKARDLISFAVETSPETKTPLDLEIRSAKRELETIDPYKVLSRNAPQ
jgi:hypothetical protein